MQRIYLEDIVPLLKPREKATHKYNYGSVGFVSGSKGMAGACVLNCKAAYRVGSGLVKTFVPESIYSSVEMGSLETVTIAFNEEKCDLTVLDKEIINSVDILSSGSGSSNLGCYFELLFYLFDKCNQPLILDAHGINLLTESMLKSHKQPLILTPHIGEFERLISKMIDDPITMARNFAMKYQVFLVLKSHESLIATPEGEIFINTTGNPGMATAGNGDVLTGMIAGLMAQHLEIKDALCAAVYLHGLSGDLARDQFGEMSMIASDIIDFIPLAMQKVSL